MTLFEEKAPTIMRLLMEDFDLTKMEAAAICGNLGHESAGFERLQEINPTVKGSRGGYGWAQWTGPRRREYEAYCKRNRLDPAGDKANYGFMFLELKGPEKRAIRLLKDANETLFDKVVAFELGYERAGVKHYNSRLKWAERAMSAFGESRPPPIPDDPGVEPAEIKRSPWAAFFVALFRAVIGWVRKNNPGRSRGYH